MNGSYPSYMLSLPRESFSKAGFDRPGVSVVLPNPSMAMIGHIIPSVANFVAEGYVIHRAYQGVRGATIRISGVAYPMRTKGDTVQSIVERAKPGQMVPARTASMDYVRLTRLLQLITDSQKSSKVLQLYCFDEGLFYEVEPIGEVRLTRSPDVRTGIKYDLDLKALAPISPAKFTPPVILSTLNKPTKKTLKEVIDAIKAAIATMTAYLNYGMNYVRAINKLINALIGIAQEAINLFEDLVDAVSEIAHMPFAWAQKLMAVGTKAKMVTEEFNRLIYQYAQDDWMGFRYIAQSAEANWLVNPQPELGATSLELQESIEAAFTADESVYSSSVSAAGSISAFLVEKRLTRVRPKDTISSIALRELGNTSEWKTLVELNNLQYPYVSSTPAPGVIAPGDFLLVPDPSSRWWWGAFVTPEGYRTKTEGEILYGSDLKLSASGDLVPTNTSSETGLNLQSVVGIACLEQTISNRLRMKERSNSVYPEAGLPLIVGDKTTDEATATLGLAVQGQILNDPRVQSLRELTIELAGNSVGVSAEILTYRSDIAGANTRGDTL